MESHATAPASFVSLASAALADRIRRFTENKENEPVVLGMRATDTGLEVIAIEEGDEGPIFALYTSPRGLLRATVKNASSRAILADLVADGAARYELEDYADVIAEQGSVFG